MNHIRSHYNHDHQIRLSGPGIFLCCMGLLAIAFSITLRLIPNILPTKILIALHITLPLLNHLYSTYLYSLTACLLLSGLMVDIVGPRKILVISLFAAVVANFLFANSDSMNTVLYARVIIGYSHIFILTSVLTLGTHWLPRRHFSLFVGLLFSVLLMTPVFVTPALKTIDTTPGLIIAVFIIDLVGMLVIAFISFSDRIIDHTHHKHTLIGLFRPLHHYRLWLISIVSTIGWMVNTFCLQIVGFYLIRHYHYGLMEAINVTSEAFIFFGLGAVVMGITSDYLQKKHFLIAVGYLAAAFCFSLLFFIPNLSRATVPWLLFLGAFFTSSTIICYTKANNYCTIGNSGITLGLVLSITTIGSAKFATTMRHLVEKYANDATPASAHNWTLIVMVIPAILVIGAIISAVFLKPHFKMQYQAPPATPTVV
jgi:MFS family permease